MQKIICWHQHFSWFHFQWRYVAKTWGNYRKIIVGSLKVGLNTWAQWVFICWYQQKKIFCIFLSSRISFLWIRFDISWISCFFLLNVKQQHYFWQSHHYVMSFFKKWKVKYFLNWKWGDFQTSFIMLWCHYRGWLSTLWQCCQHKSRNSYYQVVFVLPCNILITISTAKLTHIVIFFIFLSAFWKKL